ncbi:hypothetical protein ES707_20422 [subsurface metagenome]
MLKLLTDKIREAGTHFIIYGIGAFLRQAIGFFLIPIYTKYYTPELYGKLALLSPVGTICWIDILPWGSLYMAN